MNEYDTDDSLHSTNPKRRLKRLRIRTKILSLIQEGQFELVEKRLKKIRAGSKNATALEGYRNKDVEMLLIPDLKYGRFPIHWACLHGIRLKKKTIKALLDACPESAKKVDNEGSTPLHYLLARGIASTDVLNILLDKYPEAVMVRDNFGRTPMFQLVANDTFEKLKLSSLASLLNTKNCVESLRLPCGPLDASFDTISYESPAHSQNLKHTEINFPRVWEQPPARRTPLYLMWRMALTQRSHRWRVRGKDTVPKFDGKKMLIAINFLGCTYLREVNGIETFQLKVRRKIRRKMMKAIKTGTDDHQSGIGDQAVVSDVENETDHGLITMDGDTGSDTEAEVSMRYSINPFISFQEDEINTKSARSYDSLENPSVRFATLDDSSEFSIPQRRSVTFGSTATLDDYRSDSSPIRRRAPKSSLNVYSKNEMPNWKKIRKKRRRAVAKKKMMTGVGSDRRRSLRSFDSIDDDFSQLSMKDTIRSYVKKKSQSLRSHLSSRLLPAHREPEQRAPQTKFRFTHAVCTFHQWLPKEIIDIAKEYYPKHFEKREEVSGDIPLHLAIRTGANRDLLKILVEANRTSASIPTAQKQIPLHLLLQSGDNDFTKIQCLLHAHPDGIETIDHKTGLYPFALPEFHKKEVHSSPHFISRSNLRPKAIPESHSFRENDMQMTDIELQTTSSVYNLLLQKPSVLKEYC